VTDPTLLYPRCAVHPDCIASFSCDRCGVFYCDSCSPKVGPRLLCPPCQTQPDQFSRDLVTEGHIAAIANFNYVIATSTGFGLLFCYFQTSLLATSPVRLPLFLAIALVFGALPVWLAVNLRRYWPAGRAFQLFMALGLLGIGGLLCVTASDEFRIQGFLLADYNFAILYVLISNSGSACFTRRYHEALEHSPSLSRTTSSLYVLFVFWLLLSCKMAWDYLEFV